MDNFSCELGSDTQGPHKLKSAHRDHSSLSSWTSIILILNTQATFIISACSDYLHFCTISYFKQSLSKWVCPSKKYFCSTWGESSCGCRALCYRIHFSPGDLGVNAWEMGLGSRPQPVSGDGPVVLATVQKWRALEMLLLDPAVKVWTWVKLTFKYSNIFKCDFVFLQKITHPERTGNRQCNDSSLRTSNPEYLQ